MKQLLLSFSFLIVLVFGASAQCTPDPQFTEGGVYPDSATGLAPAYVGQPYSEVITVIVPVDTTIMVGPIPFTLVFDSVVVSEWLGLPPGFTVDYYSPNNQFSPIDQGCFEGAQTGCILISGTPTAQDVGSYQQLISTDAYSTPDSPLGEPTLTLVDYYYINVMDTTNSLNSLTGTNFSLFPNPAKEIVTLDGLNSVDVSAISLVDMNGKQHAYFDTFTGASVDINVQNLESGMYFVRIDYNGMTETMKFVKE
ncbi:MAG: T9SS type A sorting domain-containing protein [bacterium]|nr:T9SS type A sorting domain-containing protein [bacterium]